MKNYLILLLVFLCTSCTRDWLDIKSDMSYVVPTEVHELQALLDNTNVMANNVMAGVLEMSTDNVSLTAAQWNSKAVLERNAYIWEKDFDEGLPLPFWINYYGQIYYANTVLEGLEQLAGKGEVSEDHLHVRAQALFYRAWANFNLLQLFAKQYDTSSSSTDLGIPLREKSILLQSSIRESVEECYNAVIADLQESLISLPDRPVISSRPSRQASYGLFARMYLQRGEYEKAKLYADSTLSLGATLLEYHSLNAASNFPFTRFNSETIFYQTMGFSSFFVDHDLYQSFEADDHRRSLFFRSAGDQVVFKGSYANSANFFAGLAVDEMYLIRAECETRLKRFANARQDLYTLLRTRYDGTVPVPVADNLLLDYILDERRKQLMFRGLRWLDLRRLNKDPNQEIFLRRVLDAEVYELAPNDSRYVFPIPQDVLLANPSMEQNVR